MTPETVADCVERARDSRAPAARRHAAFEELARSFEAMARASALHLLHDADEAGDAAQEALLAAWLKLNQLRAPEAFGGWLKRLVSTECRRRLRKRPVTCHLDDRSIISPASGRREPAWPLAQSLESLTEPERQAIVLFYVQGCTIAEIAVIVGAPPATIGKRLYTARLKVRRALPSSVRASFLRIRMRGRRPGPDTLAEYVGVYRFEKRPELVVEIQPAGGGSFLVSQDPDQRHLLHYIGDDTLATRSFDGEGRFQRDKDGRIAGFVYYEFGVPLGEARRILSPRPAANS